MALKHVLKLLIHGLLPKAHPPLAKAKKHVKLPLNVTKKTMLLTRNILQPPNATLLTLNTDTNNGKTKLQSHAMTQVLSLITLVTIIASNLLVCGNSEELTSTKINQDSEPLVKLLLPNPIKVT